jgi:predicted metal-dependent HD superfamily phosphohydrolase
MMTPTLRERWMTTWQGLPAGSPLPGLFAEVERRYQEAHRHYHTLRHLEECFAALDGVRAHGADITAIELALWFHDAIYDVRRHDNEERSAAWAASCLERAGVAQATIDKVVSLILATRHHVPGADPDACLLVDVDLAILGAPPSRFHEYERQIRAEYAHVPDEVFARKRHELLEDFMQRPVLFSTAACRARYEQQARSNLSKALAQPQ